MSRTADADELLEIAGDELGTVVGDDPGAGLGITLPAPLDDRLDVRLGHARADLPVHDRSTAAVEQAAKVEECPRHVDVSNVDVPVLMGTKRLLEPRSLERRLGVVPFHQAGGAEHAVNAGGAGRHDIGIKHHEGEATVALQRILLMEIDDGSFFPVFEPPVAGDPAVVFVDLAVAFLPVIELARADSQPGDEAVSGDLGPFRPVADVVDDLVARVVGNPGSGQSSPSSFFLAWQSWIDRNERNCYSLRLKGPRMLPWRDGSPAPHPLKHL